MSLVRGTDHQHNQPAVSCHGILVIRDYHWSQSAGGRHDEGPQSHAGLIQSPRSIGGKGMQLSCSGHSTHPLSSENRTSTHSGVHPDTVSTGLLQCCVAWSSASSIQKLQHMQNYTVSQKKVPTIKLSVTLSNLNRLSKCLHCWKLLEICYKTHMTLPT